MKHSKGEVRLPPKEKTMEYFQEECLTVAEYVASIGKSVRSVQRYIAAGMPAMKAAGTLIHLPTANAYWASQITSTPGTGVREVSHD